MNECKEEGALAFAVYFICQVPPTLTIGPNGPSTDHKFTLPDPRIPGVSPFILLFKKPGIDYSYVWKSTDWSARESWWYLRDPLGR